jgi:hypothetical protein
MLLLLMLVVVVVVMNELYTSLFVSCLRASCSLLLLVGIPELSLELSIALFDLGEAFEEDSDAVGIARTLLLEVSQGLLRLCSLTHPPGQGDEASTHLFCGVHDQAAAYHVSLLEGSLGLLLLRFECRF